MYQPIDCVQTNVQPGFRRALELMKPWRCELTGLSHSYNLYFVACNTAILVYIPSFPSQDLPAEPDLILRPPISSPNLDVGIDPIHPHSITRLHIDYLGREEVVLVTCDDGDVVGYRVPEVYRVITENQRSPKPLDCYHLEQTVRVFLHRNVGASAWGLAIHREARLIAISANTHRVTVLAYALSGPAADSDVDSFESDDEEEDFPYPRRRDHVISLKAKTNIPAVYFNQEDASGRWLFSSSIDGDNHLWDLYNPDNPARMIELGYCVSAADPTQPPGVCRCHNRTSVPHAAWGAMFIDPLSCHRTKHFAEACGSGYGSNVEPTSKPGFWDITEKNIRFSAKRSGPMPGDLNQPVLSGDSSDVMSLSGSESSAASGSIDGEDEGEESGHSSPNDEHVSNAQHAHTDTPLQEVSALIPPSLESSAQSTSQPPNHATDLGDAQSPTNLPPQPPTLPEAGQFVQQLLNLIPEAAQHPELTALWLDANDPIDLSDDDESDGSISQEQQQLAAGTLPVNWISLGGPHGVAVLPHPATPPLKHPYCSTSTAENFEATSSRPSNPCVIVTKEEIYLFQRPFDSTSDGQDPILFMKDPLFPPMKSPRMAPNYHRNCYAAQIPELGIFIIASPAGRVGIFSLTQYTGHLSKKEKPLYAFRMDHLIPSSRSNDGGVVVEEVWGRRLIGVAVGPVQGMLDREEDVEGVEMGAGTGAGEAGVRMGGGRRWRLMLHFHDHTVYSYELGKFGGSQAPGLGDLVV